MSALWRLLRCSSSCYVCSVLHLLFICFSSLSFPWGIVFLNLVLCLFWYLKFRVFFYLFIYFFQNLFFSKFIFLTFFFKTFFRCSSDYLSLKFAWVNNLVLLHLGYPIRHLVVLQEVSSQKIAYSEGFPSLWLTSYFYLFFHHCCVIMSYWILHLVWFLAYSDFIHCA